MIRRELPRTENAGGAGFVTGLQSLCRPELCNEFADRFQPVRHNAKRTDFSVRFGYGNGDGVRVDIQTNKSYLRHATNSFRVRQVAASFLTSQLTAMPREELVASL